MAILKNLLASNWAGLALGMLGGFLLGIVCMSLITWHRSKRDPLKAPVAEGGGWPWWLLCLIVLVIWAATGFGTFALVSYINPQLPPSVKLSDTGTFGDTFGAVNSLFSALGVAGVAYALILQSREQGDARREAVESKKRESTRDEAAQREAAADRKHAAELTMLAALVHARSAELQANQSRLDEAERSFREASKVGPFDDFRERKENMEKCQEILARGMFELKALINYSESQSGWPGKKILHYSTATYGEMPEVMPRRPDENAQGEPTA